MAANCCTGRVVTTGGHQVVTMTDADRGPAAPGGKAVNLDGLPPRVATVLSGFVAEAQRAYEGELVSIVLFGSAVDGTLGPTSDVNLLLLLRSFHPDRMARIRGALLTAEAAIKLRVMFLLEAETAAAIELFAQKFADILRRHRIVYGADAFASVAVPREAEKFRLRQVLLNLTLRLREGFVLRGDRPEQVARILAEAFGPLRAAAATLLELEGSPASTADEALARVAAAIGPSAREAVAQLAAVHHGGRGAVSPAALVEVIAIAVRLSERAARLP
jgi:predicted nucleotidyltransferase